MQSYSTLSIVSGLVGILYVVFLVIKFVFAIGAINNGEVIAISISFVINVLVPLFFALLGLVLAMFGFLKKQKYKYLGFMLSLTALLLSILFLQNFEILFKLFH